MIKIKYIMMVVTWIAKFKQVGYVLESRQSVEDFHIVEMVILIAECLNSVMIETILIKMVVQIVEKILIGDVVNNHQFAIKSNFVEMVE